MKIDEYKAAFVSFHERANNFNHQCKTKDDLHRKINDICTEAALFYTENSNQKESDYQLKIEIFLTFDRFLKDIKRNFAKETNNNRSLGFFNAQEESQLLSSENGFVMKLH